MRRARILAFFLDLLLRASCADAGGLAATALLWVLPRDARGGLARRWLGLEAVGADGRLPGKSASIRRNLPLLVPVWNVRGAWPVLRDGEAVRAADRKTGVRIRQAD